MTRQTSITANMDKWCRYIVLAGHVIGVIILSGHIVWYNIAGSELALPRDVYMRDFIILPAIGILLVNILVRYLVFSTDLSHEVKEGISLGFFIAYAFYLTMTHDISRVLLSSYMFPIFASTVFSNVKLTRRIFVISMFAVWLPVLRWQLMGTLNSTDFMEILISSSLYIAAFSLARVIILYGHHNLAAIKESREEALRNELAFLQAQIKPHFLFNSISTVISFCYTDGEKAADLLTHLVKYLRLVTDIDQSSGLVTISNEIELIKHYVTIQHARFGEKIRVIYDVDPELSDVVIPSFSIQPLVENALKHGIMPLEDGGTVKLSIHKIRDTLEIVVRDNGVGVPEELVRRLQESDFSGGGVGMFNVYRRIMSWRAADIDIESREGDGTLIRINVPGLLD